MTEEELSSYLSRLYRLMALFAAAGCAWYFHIQETRSAIAFLLGVLGSFANLLLFNWLSKAIAPGGSQKPWQAGAFIGRYLLLFAFGYVIVKGLDVSPLPVVFGLFASTAAVLISAGMEIILNLLRRGHSP